MSTPVRLAVVGDVIMQHPVSACRDPGVLAAVELLRATDATVANLECCIQNLSDFPAYVAGAGRATTFLPAPVSTPQELRWFGIDMVFTANNHSQDFAEAGIMSTLRHLDAAGIPHAGTGASLSAATAPAYFQTAGGRVAVVGCADWGPRGLADLAFPWPMGALASDPDPMFRARPGVNLLRYDAVTHVDGAAIDALRRISEALGWERSKAIRNAGGGRSEPLFGTRIGGGEVDGDGVFHFMGRKFVMSDEFSFETVAYEEDLERNQVWIRQARQTADIVVAGIHQQGASRSEAEPPDHVRAFAYAAVDAGADIVVAHGRARAGGVEAYKGRPIVYGLPGLLNQLEQVPLAPSEQMPRFGLSTRSTASDFLSARRLGEGDNTAIGNYSGAFRKPMVLTTVAANLQGGFEIGFHPFAPVEDGPIGNRGLPRLLVPGSSEHHLVLEEMALRNKALGSDMTVDGECGVVRTQAAS
jgi:poly-gamma-glutamate synthesis protein (capsule biosynthesis protein)